MMRKILVFAAAAALVLGLSVPSWAVADFDIGASVRLETGWQFSDFGDARAIGAEDSQTQFYMRNPGTGRLNFKATVGDVTGFIEYALNANGTLRHGYLEWDMGGGMSLLVGQTWALFSPGAADQRLNFENSLTGFGVLYYDRIPQVRFTYAAETFTIQASAEDSRQLAGASALAPAGAGGYQVEDPIPAFTVLADFKPMEMLSLTPSIYFQTYDYTAIAPGTVGGDQSVDSWVLCLDARVDVDMFTFKGEIWYGNNVGDSASFNDQRPNATTVLGSPGLNTAGTDLEDTSAWGGFAQVTFALEPALINLGFGTQQADTELRPSAAFEDDVTTWGAFVNVVYNLTDNFWIVPELLYQNYGDDANKNAFGAGRNDLGNDMIIGVLIGADF
jgi:hypothetical protein